MASVEDGAAHTLSMDVKVVDGMVPKAEFDRAIEAAQQALRAKTASSQQMLAQASGAMRNALTALSLSEQEVANLKATVKELQERPAEGTNEIIEREREELRTAQQRVADLSSAFRQLQGEVARVRYEQEGFDMPVGMSLPVKIAPELSSRVTVIAQLVMLGYAYEDGEMALDAIRVNDLHLALEWLEGRHATKTQFSINQRRAAMLDDTIRSPALDSPTEARRITTTNERTTTTRAKIQPIRDPKSVEQPKIAPIETEQVRVIARTSTTQRLKVDRGRLSMYEARKRAVSSMICMAINPPGSMRGLSARNIRSGFTAEEIAERCIAGLARLAQRSGSFMILSLGGNRCAFDCVKLYGKNPRMVINCFRLMRALASNPITMMHVKKQQRFRLLPTTVSQAVGLHEQNLEVVSEGAHTLWASNTLGGKVSQERCKSSGILRYVKAALVNPQNPSKDPDGAHRKNMIGMLLSMANENKTMQTFFVKEGYRAIIRKVLHDFPAVKFGGEFSSMSDWLTEEYNSPSFAPDDGELNAPAKAERDNKSVSAVKNYQKVAGHQQHAALMRDKAKARGVNPEQMYMAKKRVVTMLCKIALNPPGSVQGVSKAENEEIAYRSLLALARITEKGSGYLVLTSGGPRTAVDCIRYYIHNADIMYACCRILRDLLTNPSTMMHLVKQVRFKILPSAIMDAVARHVNDLEMKSEAAHALWAYTGVGGEPAQQTLMDCGPLVLDFLKDGLAEARANVSSNQHLSTVRKFIGCILSLANDNKDAQDKLVAVGLRSATRKALSEHQSISFHGEFSALRDWIRGDRGGAKSTSRSAAVSRTERNAAETVLGSGQGEGMNVPVDHIKAQQLFAHEDERQMSGTQSPSLTRAINQQEQHRHELTDSNTQEVKNALQSVLLKQDNEDGRNFNVTTETMVETTTTTKIEKLQGSNRDSSVAMHDQWNINECISILKAHDNRLHKRASERVAEMFSDEPTTGIAFVLNGGLDALMHALSSGNGTFAAGACALIHMLCSSDLALRRCQSDDSVLSGTLFSAIIQAMSTWPKNDPLQQWGPTALWVLLKDNPRAKASFLLIKTSRGVAGLRVLKDSLKAGADSEAVVRANVGCLLSLAMNSIPAQKMIGDLALPNVILTCLSRHPTISYRGQFDSLREWLRDSARQEEEIASDVSFRQ